ncbi:MAG: acyl carrier protein [Pelodictyon phaeoclathratiforme]
MSNEERLVKVFSEALDIDSSLVVDNLQYNSIPEWDSIAHMALVAALESEFDIMMDTDDIIDMSSVQKAKEILAKYEVSFT